MNAQTAFLNDMSKSLSRSFQEMCQLNIQLGQTILEESTLVGQQLLTTERPTDIISAAAVRAHPASEKLRAYQQHLSRVAADSQVKLAKVAEQHVQETSRTARALADQVANTTAEQADRAIREQEESQKNFRDPFEHEHGQRSNGHVFQGSMHDAGGANGRMDGSLHVEAGNDSGTSKGNLQGGNNAQSSQQTKSGKPA
ncbi:TIGR01841 family phasin [Massilia jejuensis]|uniref:TIGR01841 family phasin n=1 Tax=Massilia jejuensis TaxID=648894 RepID=A0ABW0PJP1_9BURK